MRFLDLAIDISAVLSASRSVASRHAALRSRQLDVYKNSNAAATVKNPTANQYTEAPGKDESKQTTISGESSGHIDQAANSAGFQTGEPQDSTRQSEELDVEHHKKIPTTPFTEDDKHSPPGASRRPNVSTKLSSDQLDIPPGIDVNVFHTSRGSRILDSLGKQKTPVEKSWIPVQNPAKDHPLRHWPRPPPVEVKTSSSTPTKIESHGSDNIEDNLKPFEKLAETHANISPNLNDTSLFQYRTRNDSAVSSDTEKVAETMVQFNQEPVISDVVSTVPGASTSTYQLRESSVPSTRFSRILNYGGLAAGMLGGAVTEGVSRAFGGGGEGSVLLSNKNMERLVAKLSRMRGAALKLGQMMSFQDSKMLPAPMQEVLQRVQDKADYMPSWQRDRVLATNLGSEWRDLFSEFEEKPIAAASIGQVHKAVLKANGQRVAVKIQFPGVAESINSDLDNLGILLTATKLLPRGLYLNKTIDNARLELGWECDYSREADCAKRYKELLQGEEDVFVAPNVYPEASGKQVLTMDFLDGIGVTRVTSFSQEQRDWIGTQLLRLCLREITEFKFMQTDPNWTNFLYNKNTNKLELLDFGASREFPERFISQYVQLLECASRADRDGVKRLSEGLGYLTGHESKTMLDAHIQSVLTLAEPFRASAPEVYDFRDQTITERVKALIPVMLHERLAPPPEETYSLHRKLSGAFLLCAKLQSKVRCRELFTNSAMKSGYVKQT